MSGTQCMWSLMIVAVCNPRLLAETPEVDLNRLIRPYSTQRIVGLDINETFTFKLKDGGERIIRVVSVDDVRDSVVNLMRRAEVRVEIDGKPLELTCMPYVMPTETAGLRILADTTSGWGNISKRVQLSLWDAADPIVDVERFHSPLGDYRLLSHGTQCYNEPVHLGAGDEDPAGLKMYHDYGFDQAGFEGKDVVLSPVAGTIVMFWPSREDLCSAVVRDENGLNWELAHLKSVDPETVIGRQVAPGDRIGLLGRTGPSGNFAHLHLGTYLNQHDLDTDNRDTRLNLYPWLVAAYQAQHPKGLLAVARPHQVAKVGESVDFDGGNSLIWGSGRIIEYKWVFPDGQVVKQAKTRQVFDKPGAYVAALWVKDDKGRQDVDFCPVKVYSKDNPEKTMPHIFMTQHPTEKVRPGQPVTFRFWTQGGGCGPITVEFDDGERVSDYQSYAELTHAFAKAGVHVVTTRCESDGKMIVQMLKVLVNGK